MNQFTFEEIKEYVIDDISMWFSKEEGNAAYSWDADAIINYFKEVYEEEFEIIEDNK